MASRVIQGKTIVVTGGSRGIGLALVKKLLARESNTVIATTRDPKGAVHLTELLSQQQQPSQHGSSSKLVVTKLDTSVPASIDEWATQLQQEVKHIDILINNAGIYGPRKALGEFTAEDMMSVYSTNAVGPFLLTQALHSRGLLGPPHSLLLNMSSIMSSMGEETVSGAAGGGYAYRASKSALNIITKALALDLAKDCVECLLMHPGYVRTDMTGGQGWVDVEQSSAGIMAVLESGRPLSNKFIAYDGKEIPW